MLNKDAWAKISPFLDQALDVSPLERTAWLAQLAGSEPDIAIAIRALLAGRDELEAQGFLEGSIVVAPPAPSLAGKRVGSYTIDSLVGRGGMGEVWLALRNDGRFEGRFALKFLYSGSAAASALDRFRREGRLLGRLTHPNIARLIDAGATPNGQPYLVLEYVDGERIDRFCDVRSLDIEARLRLVLDVLSAVAHAHANLVVHRDIKPSNVLVTKDGQVKLLDFGIAKLLETEGQAAAELALTREGGAALTPEYAAPEQVTGGPVTTATDVYSLGVLTYVLLTGQHPAGTGAQSVADLVEAIVERESSRLSDAVTSRKLEGAAENAAKRGATPDKLRRLLRGDVDTIVAKALKKNPQERYASATALADDIRRYLRHEPIGARPDTIAYRSARFVRRNRLAVTLASLAVIAGVAGVAGTLIQAHTARVQRDFAFGQLKRSQEHDEFLEFLLSNAAPIGKPFSANDLLARGARIVERQHAGNDDRRADLMIWIGRDYLAQDQNADGRRLLEKAYELAHSLSDPAIRAAASCALADSFARDEEVRRAESLYQEGLRELSGDPRFALVRVSCLRDGSEIARDNGDTLQGVARAQEAQRVLRASPFRTDVLDMAISLDLASAYSEAGQDLNSLAEFERVGMLQSSLGMDETQDAAVLFTNWGLELDQVGRPLAAERIYRRALDINRDDQGQGAVFPMVLLNYARILRELDRLNEAADYAERAYAKAILARDELIINQSLLERARIYLALHRPDRASDLLMEAEPRLRQRLPEGHYAFASLAGERSLIALEKGEISAAMQLGNQAVAIDDAAIKAGGEGAFYLPTLLVHRSAIEIADRKPARAAADANRALRELQSARLGTFSSKMGYAYLALARALGAQGKEGEAHSAARSATEHLESALGPDHPDALAARQLSGPQVQTRKTQDP